MCVFFLALFPRRKIKRNEESASKPNPHIFAQLSRMRKQLAACCKKLFLKVDKIAVKKPRKTQEGIIGKHPRRQDDSWLWKAFSVLSEMTVVVLLVGSTTGGILVDHFGIFESPKKAVNKQKILGVLIMILGAAAIKLL